MQFTKYAASTFNAEIRWTPGESQPADWETIMDACGLSFEDSFSVYELGAAFEKHPAGSLTVLLASGDVYIQDPPVVGETGYAIVEKGAEVPAPTAARAGCIRCPALAEGRTCIVEGTGVYRPALMVVGEAPGAEEDRSGSPFVGQSGKLLRATLAEFGLTRGDLYFTNAVRCRPPENRTPQDDELEHCRPWLDEELARVQPRMILAVGKTAATQLTRLDSERLVAGRPGIDWQQVYHPAYIMRNPRKRAAWLAELKGIADVCLGHTPSPDLASHGTSRPPDPDRVDADWSEGPVDYTSPWLAADTEFDDGQEDGGYGSTLVSLQFSDGRFAEFHGPLHALDASPGPGRLRPGVLAGRDAESTQPGLGAGPWPADAGGAGGQSHLSHPGVLQPAPHRGGDAPGEPAALPEGELAAVRPEKRPLPYSHVWGHHIRADARHLGLNLRDLQSWDDTALVAYVLRYPETGLKKLGPQLTGLEMRPITDFLRTWIDTTRRLPGEGSVTHPDTTRKKGWLVRMSQGGHRTSVWLPTEAEALQARLDMLVLMEPTPGKPSGHWEKCNFSAALSNDPVNVRNYAMLDAVVTSRVAAALWPRLQAEPRLLSYYNDFEKPTVPVLADLEDTGVLINPDQLTQVRERLDTAMVACVTAMDLSEETIRSNARLAQVLLDRGFRLRRKTPTGQWQVDRATLLELAGVQTDEQLPPGLIHDLLKYREYGKLKSTYVDALLAHRDTYGRVHARFNQMVTDTNRLSSSDPNLQNIPARTALGREIRRAFVASPGHVLVKADFSQLEVRIYAHYTHEPVLLAAYTHRDHDTAGPDGTCGQCDVHQSVATELHIPRKRAKNVLFGAIYGADAPKLAETAGVGGPEAGLFLSRLRERLPSLLTWQTRIANELTKQGYVETLFGWRNYYPLFMSPLPRESRAALREAANLPIQGTAGGILKLLFQHVQPHVDYWGARLVLTVHDEVVYEIPGTDAQNFALWLEIAGREMAEVAGLDVPLRLEVEIGRDWANMRPWREWDG